MSPRAVPWCRGVLTASLMAVAAACTPGTESGASQGASTTPATGTNTGGLGSGNNAASPNVAEPTLPNMAGAQGSMTIAADSAPDLCLAVLGGTGANASVVLRTCDASLGQRWVVVSGVLQSAQGSCLTLNANAVLSASNVALAACDANAQNQRVSWAGGRLTVATPQANYALQPDGSPPSTRSEVQFAPFDAKNTQQQWQLGQYSHDDGSKLIANGTHIVPLDARTTCLSATDSAVSYAPCSPADANQAWRLMPPGRLQNRGNCLQMLAATPTMAPCSATNANQTLGVSQGIIYSPTSQCLAQDPNDPETAILETCDLVTSRSWAVGLSQ